MFILHQGFLYFQLNFSAKPFIVLQYITDADIVDKRKPTATMAVRCEYLSNLDESVLWRLNCGDVAFLLQLTLGQGLRRETDIPETKFCVHNLGESMQIYPYPADLQSLYCVGLKSYGCCQLLSLFYQPMRAYIKFEFLGEVVRTQSWVTVHSTQHVLVCVDAHILLNNQFHQVCGRLWTHKRIIMQVRQCLCNSLHPFYPTWLFTRCCKDLPALSNLDSSEYYLPCYPAIWKFMSNGDSQLNEILVLPYVMMRFAEIFEYLKFNDWVTVKRYIYSPLLGGRVMLGTYLTFIYLKPRLCSQLYWSSSNFHQG
ncbi:uncharacterized protein LOC113339096 [Papaver somniferum]|uniref:uncharacterized protein LOC113339096 n=1 Tax=Papaver somniferum TaxID=3469 RepID=UPI000E7033E3|nr:uncharacterized protein LOC113339096 [Papaver somniferum]